MSAYLIADLDVHDTEGFQPYREGAGAFVAKHGGQYLAAAGEVEVMEGDWEPHRLFLIQFPDRKAIRNFLADPDYASLKNIRFKTAKTIVVAVDGVE